MRRVRRGDGSKVRWRVVECTPTVMPSVLEERGEWRVEGE